VVFSTHVMQHAERLCDQVVLMASGRKVFDGTVAAARAATPRVLTLEGNFDPEAVSDLPGLEHYSARRLENNQVQVAASLASGAPAQETIRHAFARGIDISRFEVREPTLHDAFIVLTGGELTSE
jgi:ABC-2 type transport system ATP-binding protein